MYIDESGDSGDISANSPTNFFVLSAIVVQEHKWGPLLDDLISFRRNLRNTKGLRLREEIHASAFINKPGDLSRIKRNDRLDILKKTIDWVASKPEISVITVVVDKKKNAGRVFEIAWERMIQRFENTLKYNNFPDALFTGNQRGMMIPDNTDNKKLKALTRKMRRFNPIPNMASFRGGHRNLLVSYVIEDPFMKDSEDSYFHQTVDVVAYFAKQMLEPNSYIKKKGANFYPRLLPVINKKVTSGNGNPYYLVRT